MAEAWRGMEIGRVDQVTRAHRTPLVAGAVVREITGTLLAIGAAGLQVD
jgi:hypothetical protein